MSGVNRQAGRLALGLAIGFGAPLAIAGEENATGQTSPDIHAEGTLEQVVVSARRSEQRLLDSAASIDLITAAQIHDGQAGLNLSEPLARAPGLFALNRQNYAQDLLISSRGFGANSTFGARGIKILVDGIPGTMADGQGQISHIDLASADHIEVMRGPFSVMYGNSAGGVLAITSESGRTGLHATPYFGAGSFGQWRAGFKLDGTSDSTNYLLDAGDFHTDGYREHSAAERENQNAKLRIRVNEDTQLTLIANNVRLSALDPLGLTTAQLARNQSAAGNGAVSFQTRKRVAQIQGGFVLDQRVGTADSFSVAPYVGQRQTEQYLAAAGNGVIDLDRSFFGLTSAWHHRGELVQMPLDWVAGLDAGANADNRLAYTNAGGVRSGGATQDYSMGARNVDIYWQGELRPAERFALTAGVRDSRTDLESYNNLASIPTPGEHVYHASTGMVSLQYELADHTSAYASLGSGFDTPTLNQVFYSAAYVTGASSSNAGNIGLRAASTRQAELGIKSQFARTGWATFAIYSATTRDEIVIDSSVSGRAAFTNAPRTEREGAELSVRYGFAGQWQASAALTVIDARVSQTYYSYAGNAIATGNRIPGVPRHGLFSELMWRRDDRAAEWALEARANGAMAVNDVNAANASGYLVLGTRGVLRQSIGQWHLSEFVRVDNLFDRAYVGSVIVNQGSSQFYEGAPGRNWMAGINAQYDLR